MTIVRLADDRLWVHSPNAATPELLREIQSMGEVAAIIAPNSMHGFAINDFAKEWPKAKVFAPEGFRKRHPHVRLDGVLGPGPEALWEKVLDQTMLEGNMFLSECVFLHRSSHTLLVTDFIEFLRRTDLNLWGRTLGRIYGILDKPAPSPETQMYTLSEEAARASISIIEEWDFDRIVIAHGELIDKDAKRVFETVAARVLNIAMRRGPLRRCINALLARWQ